ncbi:MAG TPA: AMP-binding protein [Streptosporangiaceae bacterium]|nr:AMP-binding protein [Streptosporangiaceae bacterium]
MPVNDGANDGASAPLFASPHITLTEAGPDADRGSLLLQSAEPLGRYPRTVLDSARAWARVDPHRVLVAEREGGGEWRICRYGGAMAAADSVGQALLDRGLGPDRPLLVLSGNSVDHLIVTLGAMSAGIPVAPVSPAYSLQSHDHTRLRQIAALTDPGAVFADHAEGHRLALDAVVGVSAGRGAPALPVIVSNGRRDGALQLGDLRGTTPGPALAAASAAITPDSVTKILFTSGSTGAPKGVLNTHRMLAANPQMIRQVWPFLAAEPPVIVDWLPWSHTFGGNHNLNMVLTNGGTVYIDAGRPAPARFGQTVRNLADVPPTVYFNVPAGYAQLAPALEADPDFARRFFARLRLMFNAAAALPAALRDRLGELAVRTTGQAVPVTGSWGATETGPAVTTAHFAFTDARGIGAPLPGALVKLVPAEEAYEIRVKGPMVTPGYRGRPDLTAAAFDAEGFYRSGDAAALADPDDPDAGLVFRGRLAEDFKLTSGTFVRVGAVRTALLSAAPLLADAVIAGEDRSIACALAWLNQAQVAGRPADQVRADLAAALARHNQGGGSAARIERLILLDEPADLDAGEITDKGYVNQRQVLRRRAGLVERLYADPPPPEVIVAGGPGLPSENATES